ncbi:MAG TPA: nucleoside-diphosphate sugar epimerase [Cyanobacteria bacterium UBA11149]|nr:nucleoside-diphosphate sugar epimerase [Cyanobacteria bacterium UBA11367]HBE57013.1 nucleoside-diphosphate sugar epimerase [Cyanobacteria bacterium UBA11366]HBK66740.1 nucleoside-diphosphate sugar epimerase [Cyanobacteria bacterium UBA11166]HBR73057.1 nucleoside-diphosphate sugar epimerase [Cyanobacteria bacterium UBA11159]HBS72728.1 nucleoside-diphosphate sugar epimerase [Cyanobacteria bacterium UBA11153]HBW88850.1 nucleoside-diphosphate sugar epimerase [Cyanobacteria bacterium UBA11149]H
MANYLILGGSGFIGGNLARGLVAKGERPKIFTRSTSSITNIEDILDRVDIVYGDFMDDVAVRRATKGIDTVFHLISTTFPSMTIESSVYDVFSNLVPTIRLVEICKENGVSKIVYGSSGGTIYGEPQEIPIPENHPLQPQSAYGQSKLTIDNYLSFYARTTELDIHILRISNPFGPGQKLLGVQGLVAVAMGCAYYNRVLKIYGKGESVRDYIYIDDLVDALIIAGERSGSSIVNISSGIGQSVMEIVKSIEEVSGKTIPKEFIPNRPGDVKVSILANKLAQEIYGWKPKVDFKEGLSMTWKYIVNRQR